MFFVYRSDIGDWVINGGSDCRHGVELYWHSRDGGSERAGIYHAIEHATGAVQCQVTGLDCWDLLREIPEHIDNPASWEQLDQYP